MIFDVHESTQWIAKVLWMAFCEFHRIRHGREPFFSVALLLLLLLLEPEVSIERRHPMIASWHVVVVVVSERTV
jgi:hypothetical protein